MFAYENKFFRCTMRDFLSFIKLLFVEEDLKKAMEGVQMWKTKYFDLEKSRQKDLVVSFS